MDELMSRDEKSFEASIIIGALEVSIEVMRDILKKKEELKFSDKAVAGINQQITDTEKVLSKYVDIFNENSGPSVEEMEDWMIRDGKYKKEDVEKARLQRGKVQAIYDLLKSGKTISY